jgi:predicted TIM-barrel fold metal-dependent hydrolase
MAQTLPETTPDSKPELTRPLVIVSGDSHVGPLLEDLAPYCPAAWKEEFDAFVSDHRDASKRRADPLAGLDMPEARELAEQFRRGQMTAGHHDVQARLADMDRDGIAAEVIFHGSQNLEPLPLIHKDAGMDGAQFSHAENHERSAAGVDIYNRWLADMCAVAPERLMGAVQLPLWDVEASVRELEAARNAGLRAVNLSAPRAGLLPYDDPAWEPFWSACEDLDVWLATHSGSVDFGPVMTTGPHFFNLLEIESGGWPARRALPRLIFGGVFARHPRLRLVLTEQNGDWWSATVREYDSSYATHRWQIREQVPEPPSFYLHQNVFIGASFMAPFEAETAVREGYWRNVIWGRDYPHIEGTYQYQEDGGKEANPTRLALRYAFSGIDAEKALAMVGTNGVRVYGLDAGALQAVADRIGAPTLAELAEPIDEIPKNGGVLSFRTIGPWG